MRRSLFLFVFASMTFGAVVCWDAVVQAEENGDGAPATAVEETDSAAAATPAGDSEVQVGEIPFADLFNGCGPFPVCDPGPCRQDRACWGDAQCGSGTCNGIHCICP